MFKIYKHFVGFELNFQEISVIAGIISLLY